MRLTCSSLVSKGPDEWRSYMRNIEIKIKLENDRKVKSVLKETRCEI